MMMKTLGVSEEVSQLKGIYLHVNLHSVQIKLSVSHPNFFYNLYTWALSYRYRKNSLYRLQVCYNKSTRHLQGIPPWCGALNMFEVSGKLTGKQRIVCTNGLMLAQKTL